MNPAEGASGRARTLAFPFRRIAAWLAGPPWPEAAVFLGIAGIYLYNSVRLPYPPGSAGLFSMMTDVLIRQPLPLPSEIPYYGPGGIPFAYPPLGLYVAAFFQGVLHVPLFTYLQWAPPLITILAMIALYLLGRQLSGDRLKGLVAVVLVASAEVTYDWHATSSGMVRSVGLLLAILGVYFTLRAFAASRKWLILSLLAGLCLGLTLLTHLAYAVFVALGIGLMAVFASPRRRVGDRAKVLGVILVSGLGLSALWWGTVIQRHGLAPFASAWSTQATVDSAWNLLTALRDLLRWVANLGSAWWPRFLAGLALAGFAYAVATGRWLLPVWMASLFVVVSDTDRFHILLSGLLIAELLVDVSRSEAVRARGRETLGQQPIPGLLFLALVLGTFLAIGFRGIQWTPVQLTDDLVEVAAWIKGHSPEGGRYLLLDAEPAVAEWLPYLASRTPAFAGWGAEWTGEYRNQVALYAEMEDCVRTQRSGCVNDLLGEVGGEVQLLVIQSDLSQIKRDMETGREWEEVFNNGGYTVLGSWR